MRIAMLLLAVASFATPIDGIVATVGRAVITDGMVRRALRVSAFLAREPLDESAGRWEAVRGRLIEQEMIKGEIRIARYPEAQPDEIRAAIGQIRNQFGGAALLEQALREYRITEADLAENTGWQLTFARFISYRFRPSVQVSDEALRKYYAIWNHGAGPKPSFEDARDLLEAAFVAEESSKYLDRWLAEERQRTRIELFRRREDPR